MSEPPNQAALVESPRLEDVARCLNVVLGEYCSFVKGLGPILDGVGRAQESAASEEEARRWEIVRRQLFSLLVQHGIRPTAHVGGVVDLRYHEVVATEPASSTPPDTVVKVQETGLELTILGQRLLLRTARVVIAAEPKDGPRNVEPTA
jgi:molecular chaperone GrpE (heat shock protein)